MEILNVKYRFGFDILQSESVTPVLDKSRSFKIYSILLLEQVTMNIKEK